MRAVCVLAALLGVGTQWVLAARVFSGRVTCERETKCGTGKKKEELRHDIAHLFPSGIRVEINIPAKALICQQKYKRR